MYNDVPLYYWKTSIPLVGPRGEFIFANKSSILMLFSLLLYMLQGPPFNPRYRLAHNFQILDRIYSIFYAYVAKFRILGRGYLSFSWIFFSSSPFPPFLSSCVGGGGFESDFFGGEGVQIFSPSPNLKFWPRPWISSIIKRLLRYQIGRFVMIIKHRINE